MNFLRKLLGKSNPQPPPLPKQPEPKASPPSVRPLRLTVGPSPWAWRDRSHIMGGCRYRFRDLGEEGNLSGVTTVLNERDETILLLDFQIYARFLDDGRVLLWWEEGEKDFKEIAFSSFTFDSLRAIENPVEAAKQMRETKAKTVGLDGITTVRFQCFLEAGRHVIATPEDWKDFEETLVLADHATGSNGYDVMHRALFVFDWIHHQVDVIPQDWFNHGKYDFGYQWVARIARTESGVLIGEGIRLGTFELDESGREVKRWLSQDPFHTILCGLLGQNRRTLEAVITEKIKRRAAITKVK